MKNTSKGECSESVQIRSFFSSVFSRIWTEYGKILIRKNSVFVLFSRSVSLIILQYNFKTLPVYYSNSLRVSILYVTKSKKVCAKDYISMFSCKFFGLKMFINYQRYFHTLLDLRHHDKYFFKSLFFKNLLFPQAWYKSVLIPSRL